MRSRGRKNTIPHVCSLWPRACCVEKLVSRVPLELTSSCKHQLGHTGCLSAERLSYQLKVSSTQVLSHQVSPGYTLMPSTAAGLQDLSWCQPFSPSVATLQGSLFILNITLGGSHGIYDEGFQPLWSAHEGMGKKEA